MSTRCVTLTTPGSIWSNCLRPCRTHHLSTSPLVRKGNRPLEIHWSIAVSKSGGPLNVNLYETPLVSVGVTTKSLGSYELVGRSGTEGSGGSWVGPSGLDFLPPDAATDGNLAAFYRWGLGGQVICRLLRAGSQAPPG